MNNGLVGSDETLLRIVEALAESDEVGVTELADRLELTKSTAHRHLKTLAAKGYAVNDDGSYRLSHQWFNLGTAVRSKRGFYHAAKSEVRSLAEQTQNTAWCAIEENGRMMFIDGAEAHQTINSDLLIGRWSPLHNTAAGKAILAHLPPERVTEILERRDPAADAETASSGTDLFDELEAIRSRGYAINRGEHISGIYALGRSVVIDDEVFGAISVASPSDELLTEDRRRVVGLLEETTRRVSRAVAGDT